jgi:hypothetical protein
MLIRDLSQFSRKYIFLKLSFKINKINILMIFFKKIRDHWKYRKMKGASNKM